MATPLTDREKGVRAHLVSKYNAARSKSTKQKRYADIMEFEDKMLLEGKNG